MQIRKFVGITIPEAMAQVKRQFGPQAVILETRKFRPGDRRTKLFTRPLFEITAAMDYEAQAGFVTGRQAYAAAAATAIEAPAFRPESSVEVIEPRRTVRPNEASIAVLEQEQLAPLREEIGSLRREAETVIRVLDLTPENPQLAEELKEIRRLLAEDGPAGREGRSSVGATADIPEPGRSMIQSLLGQGVDEQLIEEMLGAVRRDMQQDAGAEDECDIAALIRARLGERFSCVAPEALAMANQEQGVSPKQTSYALVGPTGVGKTTTLAKLAALSALAGKSVGLISLDTYRVAAAEQIQTYAKIMRIPVEIANNETELRAAMALMAEKDCVFIDTAGHSHKQSERLHRQAKMLAGCGVRVSLTLSLTSRGSVLREVVDAYKDAGFHEVIFTKLDEAKEFGDIINIGAYCQKSVAYLTNGQRVPEDITEAKHNEMIDLCLGRGLAALD